MRDARYDMHFSCREMHESIGEYFQLLVGRISTKGWRILWKGRRGLLPPVGDSNSALRFRAK